MRLSRLAFVTAFALTATACKTPKLAQRLPGTWYIDHYDEYVSGTDSSTGHLLDGAGYFMFYQKGQAIRQLKAGCTHGSLVGFEGNSWHLQDSLVTITDASGRVVEEWFVSKDLTDYMEWISVNSTRDTVRTMYLRK